MFIGHFALGLAAKRAAPRVSLAVLFLAAQFADVLLPILLATGAAQVRINPGNPQVTQLDFLNYPWSPSLVMLVLWGAVLGWMFGRVERRGFTIIAALVVSHWVLDVITHRSDLPLY